MTVFNFNRTPCALYGKGYNNSLSWKKIVVMLTITFGDGRWKRPDKIKVGQLMYLDGL